MIKIIDGSFLSEDRSYLDAPSYLFVSTRLAKIYPNLLESVLVRSYHSIFPGSISWKWQRKTRFYKIFGRDFWRSFGLTGITMAVLHWFGSFSPVIQKLIVHTIQPLLAAGIVLGIYSMTQHPIRFVSVGAVVIVAFLYRMVQNRHSQTQQAARKIAPVLHHRGTVENGSVPKRTRPNSSVIGHSVAPEPKTTQSAESSSPNLSVVVAVDKDSMGSTFVRPNSGGKVRPMVLDSVNDSSTVVHIYDEPSSDEEGEDDTAEFDFNKVYAEMHSWYDENHNLIDSSIPASVKTHTGEPQVQVSLSAAAETPSCGTSDGSRFTSGDTSNDVHIKPSGSSHIQEMCDPPLECGKKDSRSNLQYGESSPILDFSSSSGSDKEIAISDDSISDVSSVSDSSDGSVESIDS
jgi:hypothetical protein